MPERIAKVLEKLDSGAANAIRTCQLLALWEQVVDERVGRNTEAVKILNRTLFITAANSVWAQELGFLKKPLIEKFNHKAGIEVIADIKFKAGEMHGKSQN